MKDLYRRLVVSSISLVVLGFLLYFSHHFLFQYVVVAAIAALAATALWEYGQLVKAKKGRMVLPALMGMSVLQVFAFFIAANYPAYGSLPLLTFLFGFLLVFALHFGDKEGAVINLAVSSFGLIYVAVPMGMLVGILYCPYVDGAWWIVYLLVVTKITDIGAYFAGNLWGRHRLAPTISPKKTVEGAIFGLICAIAASYALNKLSGNSTPFVEGSLTWMYLGLILGLVGQFGDLSESLLKRDANKKDSNVLPGLGGVLDFVDSILFNAAILYIYIYFIML